MILKALEQLLNVLLKFIDSYRSRRSYNARYNKIILYQNQIKISALNGKLQIKSGMKRLFLFVQSSLAFTV